MESKLVLTKEYEDFKDDWEENYGSCLCGVTPAPCCSCTHEGNPLSLENNPHAWVEEGGSMESTMQDGPERIEPRAGKWDTEIPEKWAIGIDVVVVNKGLNFSTDIDTAKILGLTTYKNQDGYAPSNGVAYKLIGKWLDLFGIECKDTGIQYIINKMGLMTMGAALESNKIQAEGTVEAVQVYCSLYSPTVKWDAMPVNTCEFINKPVDNEAEKSIMNTIKPTKRQEGNIMSKINRSTVQANLIDLDSAINVADSLVFSIDLVVEEGKVQEAIQDFIRQNEEFEFAMTYHNEKRIDTLNLDALERHGREVMLREVTISDLHWEIK
jgi:hypothetical protein